MIPQEIIRRKRDGKALTQNEIAFIIEGLVAGSVPTYQMTALLMAIFLRGMDTEETAHLLQSMIASGVRHDWTAERAQGRIFVDKHSTGGVGDKTSLIILPLLVADGLDVPMIAGRGLGHTGGTLDKLESLPGFRTRVDFETYRGWIRTNRGAIGAQTDDFVPADKTIYALRDVTSTVESIPLIVASIMSKKLAEGLDALVLDVKFGSGSFMGSIEKARELATRLVEVGRQAGCRTSAALTNMDEPLGRTAGNALEVAECLDVLQGAGPHDTRELSVQLCARLACDARNQTAPSAFAEAVARMNEHLQSGRAYEIFVRTAVLQGAKADDVERRRTEWLSAGAQVFPLHALAPGLVRRINTRNLGLAILELGGGRKRVEDDVHFGVGFSRIKKIGEETGDGDPLCYVHARDVAAFEKIQNFLRESFEVCPISEASSIKPIPLIAEWI